MTDRSVTGAGLSGEKRPSPLGSTAKTTHGCLAEDYAPWLAMVCKEWLAEREGKSLSTPGKIMRDVAESFVAAVALVASDVTAPAGPPSPGGAA